MYYFFDARCPKVIFRHPHIRPLMDSLDDRQVETRTGTIEPFDVDQISHRIDRLINRAPRLENIRRNDLILQVCRGLPAGLLKTSDIDDECARIASDMCVRSPQFLDLAARILIDNHQKNTARSFTDKMRAAYTRRDAAGHIYPLINKRFYKYCAEHQDAIETMLDYSRDFSLSYFGMRTFLQIYGLRLGDRVIERPQDMFMRVAVALYMDDAVATLTERKSYGLVSQEEWPDQYAKAVTADLNNIRQCYEGLSLLQYTHATPTYFNAGSTTQQLSSCFLLSVEDSLEGIKSVSTDITQISKMGGGIGMHLHRIRGAHSLIRGTNGRSSGAIPFLKIYNEDMRAFNQGGRRMGSAAVYMAAHHPDIEQFIALRVPGGIEEQRARDLFPAVWLSDLFMERVRDDKQWSLFNTDDERVGPLSELYGRAYRDRYEALEAAGLACRVIKARDLMEQLFTANMRTGTPFILFSDAVNSANMQNNIGCIESSNLCTEITLYSDANESAVCNLTSVNLTYFAAAPSTITADQVNARPATYDFSGLAKAIAQQVRNLNQVIKRNRYPTVRTHRSNLKHKPIGIGVQGFADVLCKMRIPYDSERATELNKQIFETIYYAACSESVRCARQSYLAAASIYKAMGFYVRPIIDFDEQRVLLANRLDIQALNYAIEVYYDEQRLSRAEINKLLEPHIARFTAEWITAYKEHANLRDFTKYSDYIGKIEQQYDSSKDYIVVKKALGTNIIAPRGLAGRRVEIPAAYRKNKVIHRDTPTVLITKILAKHPIQVYYHARRGIKNVDQSEENIVNVEQNEVSGPVGLPANLGAYQSVDYIGNRPATYYSAEELDELKAFIEYQSDGQQDYLTSHTSAGRFHWELYPGVRPTLDYDWESLREARKKFGQANSTLIALMPTATTSQFLGNCEGFEPFMSNCYKRQTLAGEFIMYNKYLVAECYAMRLWNAALCNNLILAEGSIQHITEIPAEIRAIYKVSRDIDQGCVIQQAADRQPYVDQAQSLNLYWTPDEISLKTFVRLISAAWRAKLKTGKYYFRSLPAAMPQPFTIDPNVQKEIVAELERRRRVTSEATQTNTALPALPDCLVCGS